MAVINQEVNFDMLEKKTDGSFKKKNPSTKAEIVKLTSNNFVSNNVQDAMNELFLNVSNGKGLIATAITGKGVATSGGDTFSKMATNINAIVTDPSAGTTAVAGDVLVGKTAVSNKSRIIGTMPNRGMLNQTITTNNGQISLAAGYYTGGVIKAIFANLVAGNVKAGVNIGGVVGNLTPGVNGGLVYKAASMPGSPSVIDPYGLNSAYGYVDIYPSKTSGSAIDFTNATTITCYFPDATSGNHHFKITIGSTLIYNTSVQASSKGTLYVIPIPAGIVGKHKIRFDIVAGSERLYYISIN